MEDAARRSQYTRRIPAFWIALSSMQRLQFLIALPLRGEGGAGGSCDGYEMGVAIWCISNFSNHAPCLVPFSEATISRQLRLRLQQLIARGRGGGHGFVAHMALAHIQPATK